MLFLQFIFFVLFMIQKAASCKPRDGLLPRYHSRWRKNFAHSKPRNAGLRRAYFTFGTMAPRRASASCPAVLHQTTALFGRQKRLLFRFFTKLSHFADYIGRSGESQGEGGFSLCFARCPHRKNLSFLFPFPD